MLLQKCAAGVWCASFTVNGKKTRVFTTSLRDAVDEGINVFFTGAFALPTTVIL